VRQQAFLLGVAVEAGDRAQPSSHRRSGPPAGFEISSEGLDIDPSHQEQIELTLIAPDHELAQVQLVGVAGEAAVAGEEAAQREPLSDQRGQDRTGRRPWSLS
jgi:hypothetical protein